MSNSIAELQNKLTDGLQMFDEWAVANKLRVNTNKSSYMIFQTKRTRHRHNLIVKLGQNILSEVESIKFLGIHIQNNLGWHNHINYLYNKMKTYIPVFISLKKYLNYRHMLTIFNAKVFPLYNYCTLLFGDSSVQKLQVIQNKLLKIITNSDPLTPTKLLHQKTNMLTIKDNFKLRQVIFIYDILNNKKGASLYKNSISYNNNIHSHNTRSAGHIHLNHSSFTPYASIIERASIVYNGFSPQTMKKGRIGVKETVKDILQT